MIKKMLSKKRNCLEFIIITILIISIVVSLFILYNLIRPQNNYTYLDIYKDINNIKVNYPYFENKTINEHIIKYIDSINIDDITAITYNLNFIDKYISLLFIHHQKEFVKKYESMIFDLNGNIITNNNLISNAEMFKNKLYDFARLNNISLDNYDYNNTELYLNDNSLSLFINDNEGKLLNQININYNEIKGCLNINYEYDDNYQTTTTTTTTTNAPIDFVQDDNTFISETTKPIIQNDDQTIKYVAFTFDDGPSKYTVDIMNILSEYNATATFFQVGYMIKSNGEITKQVYDRGFEIGNHSSDHSNFAKLSKEKIIEKIEENNKYFNEITNSYMKLIRLPYGSGKAKAKEAVDYPIIGWSVDSRDWESRNTNKIVTTVMNNISDGDIVLFHDLYSTTREAIRILVPKLYNMGYKIVSVSELFKIKNIELQGKIVYNKAQ